MKGSEIGLFEYRPSWEVGLPREKILADYRRRLTLKGVAQENRMSLCRLHRLLKVHQITPSELEEVWISAKKVLCIERYDAIVLGLGHHPTATELQRIHSTRSLTTQIRRLWESIEAFRCDRGIPAPSNRVSSRKRGPNR